MARSYIYIIMICLYISYFKFFTPHILYDKILFVVQVQNSRKTYVYICCWILRVAILIKGEGHSLFFSSTLLMLKHSTHVITLKLEDPLNEIKVFKGCPLLAYVWCCKIITPVITLFIAPANSLVFSI